MQQIFYFQQSETSRVSLAHFDIWTRRERDLSILKDVEDTYLHAINKMTKGG
jgi:hypothetical protein